MIPLPTVFATAVVTKAPARLATAATRTASPRRERPRRDRGGDGVRGVVEAVREIEAEGDDDDDDEQDVVHAALRFLTKIASRTSAAFSSASTASSSRSWMSFQRMIAFASSVERNSSATASRTSCVALVLELAQRDRAGRSSRGSRPAGRPPRRACVAARRITSACVRALLGHALDAVDARGCPPPRRCGRRCRRGRRRAGTCRRGRTASRRCCSAAATTSCVSRSPSCSRSLICSIRSSPSSGKRSSSSTSRRAISTVFAEASQ